MNILDSTYSNVLQTNLTGFFCNFNDNNLKQFPTLYPVSHRCPQNHSMTSVSFKSECTFIDGKCIMHADIVDNENNKIMETRVV